MSNQQRNIQKREDAMVVAALKDVGVNANSVYDLVNSKQPYPQAIPVLLKFLPSVSDDRIKEGIARALGVEEAKPMAAETLIREFKNYLSETPSQQHTKWAIGNALATVADDSVFYEVVSLLHNKTQGSARSSVVPALCNMVMHRERAIALLMKLLDDDEVKVQAMIALGNLRVSEARPRIEVFLRHNDSWVRQQAQRAISKIDKVKQRTTLKPR
jgi:HEAT repeat protein